jgi:hypothetical protein
VSLATSIRSEGSRSILRDDGKGGYSLTLLGNGIPNVQPEVTADRSVRTLYLIQSYLFNAVKIFRLKT